MSSTDLSDKVERVKRLLLLVWVHGFKGNQASFGDFPQDVLENVQKRFPGYKVHSVIYPKYRTVGELDVATHNFVLWLYHHILELEREEVDKNGQMVHTSVILLGHSMGGMLVADAAKEVSDDGKKDAGKGKADVRGIIGLDTPFIGIHPALVSHGMEQLDAYIDKTLLDTAAFFEFSPKFIRQGLSKMGIKSPPPTKSSTPNKTKATTASREKPVGRLEKGFTNVLSVPGTASSTDWDWTREPGFGLKKVWSEVSGRSSRSSLDDSGRISRRSSRTPSIAVEDYTGVRTPPVLPPRPGSSAHRAGSSRSIASSETPDTPGKRIDNGDSDEGNKATTEATTGAVESLVESQLHLMGRPASSDKVESLIPVSTETLPALAKDADLGSDGQTERGGLDTTTSSVQTTVPVVEEPTNDHATTSELSDGSSRPYSPKTGSDPFTAETSGVPPPLPKRSTRSSTASESSPRTIETTRSPPSPDKPDLNPMSSAVTADTTAKQKQKKNWRWVKQHTDFMSSCWSVSGIARRMKAIDAMQREGLYFVNIYTTVPPSPGKTFVSLPTIHHPTRESWKPFVHPTAADQVEAHMALFDRGKNGGYEDLIKVLGDEVGMILEEESGRER